MNPHIFREYDIRGRVTDEIDREVAYQLGQALGTYYLEQGIDPISLGRDCRLSSPELNQSLAEGINSTGLNIIDLGLVPTPLLYFSLFHFNLEGGIMITGSHNPPDYNGFKICRGKTTIHGPEIQKIRQICEEAKFRTGSGQIEDREVISPYLEYVGQNIKPGLIKRNVIVDAGNGVGGLVAPEAYKSIGIDVEPLYCEPDGRFPNHHPDPTVPEYLVDLINQVRGESVDLGIAFDGDADRIGVVNHEGDIIWGDQLMIIFSRDLLARNPGAKIVGEVKCSQILYDDIEKHGGKPIMWKAGHSLIKSKMKEEGALLGGEMSGHIFMAERYFGYDDAIYAGARLLEILTRTDMSVKELLSDLPTMVNTPEIRLDCPDDKKFEIVETLSREFKKEYRVIDVDGVRVLFDDGWGLLRSSNTQPVLVMRFEAKNEARLEEIRKIFMDKLNLMLDT